MAGPLREIGLADDARLARGVDDHEVVRRDRPQADGVGRIRLVGPGPLAVGRGRAGAGPMHEPLLGQDAENLLHVVPAERLRRRERQLERRALDVIDEDVQVVGIDERALGRRVEEIRRVADDELIERRAAGHHHRRRAARPPPGAARALPRGGNRARIAGHHGHVERADVDAELERVGRDDGAHRALRAAPSRSRAGGSADSRRGSRESSRARPARPRSRPSDTSSGSRWRGGSARRR